MEASANMADTKSDSDNDNSGSDVFSPKYDSDKDNLKQLGIAGSAVAEMDEDEFEFEQQPTTKELQKIEEEEEKN
ncbi:MAG TPA: hypothetical protein VLB82_15065, partial [Thermodesulfobacteriota bacterium]|nr:hypothetical protein [Thermodesulfobacteriota bacterium]